MEIKLHIQRIFLFLLTSQEKLETLFLLQILDYRQLFLVQQNDWEDLETAEFAKHTAFIAKEHLNKCLNDTTFSEDKEKYIKELNDVSKILNDAINDIRNAGKTKSKHFGD